MDGERRGDPLERLRAMVRETPTVEAPKAPVEKPRKKELSPHAEMLIGMARNGQDFRGALEHFTDVGDLNALSRELSGALDTSMSDAEWDPLFALATATNEKARNVMAQNREKTMNQPTGVAEAAPQSENVISITAKSPDRRQKNEMAIDTEQVKKDARNFTQTLETIKRTVALSERGRGVSREDIKKMLDTARTIFTQAGSSADSELAGFLADVVGRLDELKRVFASDARQMERESGLNKNPNQSREIANELVDLAHKANDIDAFLSEIQNQKAKAA